MSLLFLNKTVHIQLTTDKIKILQLGKNKKILKNVNKKMNIKKKKTKLKKNNKTYIE